MFRRAPLALALTAALGLAACGGSGATTAPTVAPATVAPATTVPASAAATTAPASQAAADVTVNAEEVGDAGTIITDGATGLTLYYFEDDVKDSGESACSGGCLTAWPALTVEAGETPTGGPGVDATKLGTITRADNGELQVTYDGLPLYFFQNDKAPGDLNGVYEKWVTVAP
jgi:predicted lipoprotein with Yx(FWY)xxD motif